jgi:hypothetical protein
MKIIIEGSAGRSCLGLCLSQGSRPRPALFRRSCVLAGGLVPGSASSASGDRLSRSPIRSWALRRPSRLKDHDLRAAADVFFRLPDCLIDPARRLPFSVLRG